MPKRIQQLTNNPTPSATTVFGTETDNVLTEESKKMSIATIDTYLSATTKALTNKTISGASNTFSNIPNAATTATATNTASAIVARDVNGDFSTSTINGITVGMGASNPTSSTLHNTAIGENALQSNTTGVLNTAIGDSALKLNTFGNSSTACGENALESNTYGNANTAVGQNALFENTTGSYNTGCGISALYLNVTGSYNTALGVNSGPSTSVSNTICIGRDATTSTSNTTVIGNASTTNATIHGDLSSTSFNGLTLTSNSVGFEVSGGTTSKKLIVDNSLELAGTDSTKMTFPTTSATIARTDAAQTFTGVQTMTSPVFNTNITTPIIKPAADSTTAVQVMKADGTTPVVTVDTTNSMVKFAKGIGLQNTTPSLLYGIYGNTTSTNPASNTTDINLNSYPSYTEAESVTENYYSLISALYSLVGTGHTNSGTMCGYYGNVFRNSVAAGSDDTGTLTNLTGFQIDCGHSNTNASTTPLTTNVKGLSIKGWHKTGTITNMYDIFLAASSTGGTVTNRWGIYQQDTANNYLAGNLGFGVTPTAVLHLKAGTATAGTSPFKLTQPSAVVLSTPEAGAIECNDGDLLYYTIKTGPTRKTIAYTDSTMTGAYTSGTANVGITLKRGANGKCGTTTATGATPQTVSNTSIAITDTICFSLNTVGGTISQAPFVLTITAGSGFTFASGAADTSVYNYVIISNLA